MGDYHLFRGVLPQNAILITPDGRAFVIDKESIKNDVTPETWTVNYDFEGRTFTGQDVQALCEANEQLTQQLAVARQKNWSDLAYQHGKRAVKAEKLLHDFLELVEVGAVSLEREKLAALWKTYHDFLESPERVYKGDWDEYRDEESEETEPC